MINEHEFKIGDYILVEAQKGLLTAKDGDIGKVVKVSSGFISANFLYSKHVMIFKREVIRVLTKENDPEYFL